MYGNAPAIDRKSEKARPLVVKLYAREWRLLRQRSEASGAPMAELVRRAIGCVYADPQDDEVPEVPAYGK